MTQRVNSLRGVAARLCAATLASIPLLATAALAASHDQILEMCRARFHERIMACAIAKGLKGNPEAVREKCGAPLVRPCVTAEEARQAAGTPAPKAPMDQSAIAPAGAVSIQPTFVAPPRTIADITAILDSEKPDAAKVAARKAEADAAPPTNASATKLTEFYYNRGNARALLARNKEALADGLQALAATKGGVEPHLVTRVRQFVGLQYKAAGDPKDAIATFQLIVREGDAPGQRGSLINALGNIVNILISMGDVSQAGTYQGRLQQRIEEARGSVNPKWRQSYSIYGNSWEGSADGVRGLVLEARGQYPEAETAFRRSEAFKRTAVKDLPRYDFPPPPEQLAHFSRSHAANRSRVSKRRRSRTRGAPCSRFLRRKANIRP